MDSLTQVALGGAVGYAVLGSKVGRKAILWGAALGTLPDLDVFLPYAGEVEAFTYHRGFSHSLLVHFLVSPIIVWLILKVYSHTKQYRNRWFCLVFLTLSTHALLDSCTVYGTQLLWPITEYPFGISNLFIIDPIYTLPLLFGVAFALLTNKSEAQQARAASFNIIGLVLSSIYIGWSLGAKIHIDNKIEDALAIQNINSRAYLSTPAPFTTLLWRVVVMSNNQYYEGYASLFDKPEDVSFTPFATNRHLLSGIENEWGVQRLTWFTKGFYALEQQNSLVILSDLRMGTQCAYVFNFAIGQMNKNEVIPATYEKISQRPDFALLGQIMRRIWDPSVQLSPELEQGKCPNNKP